MPAVIPDIPGKFGTEEHSRVIRDFADLSATYRTIYGATSTRRKDIDCILTSIGAVPVEKRDSNDESQDVDDKKRVIEARKGFGIYTQKCLAVWGVSSQWLLDHVIGDIAGVFVPRPDLTPECKQDFQRKTERWLGITLKDFRDCARSAEAARPGVIVVALGSKDGGRARVLLECCTRLGVVNELLIDYEMKRNLGELLAEMG